MQLTSLLTSQYITSPERKPPVPNVWQVQQAKARFSELLDSSLDGGPQVVTKRGVEAAVLVSIDDWRRLKRLARRDLKDLLLAPEARTDQLAPPRPSGRHTEPPPL